MNGIIINGDVGQVINAELVQINGNSNGLAPERISEKQSLLLKVLVGKVNGIQRERDPGHHDAKIWQAVNGHVGVDHHRDMLKRDFDKAKDFLESFLRKITRNNDGI